MAMNKVKEIGREREKDKRREGEKEKKRGRERHAHREKIVSSGKRRTRDRGS